MIQSIKKSETVDLCIRLIIKAGLVCFFSCLPFILFVNAASSIDASGLSPQMVKQIKSLPLSQQRALAKQYGLNLNDLYSSSGYEENYQLGTEGEEIKPLPPRVQE